MAEQYLTIRVPVAWCNNPGRPIPPDLDFQENDTLPAHADVVFEAWEESHGYTYHWTLTRPDPATQWTIGCINMGKS